MGACVPHPELRRSILEDGQNLHCKGTEARFGSHDAILGCSRAQKMILRQRVAWGKLYYDLRHVYCSDFAKNGTKYGHNFNQTLYMLGSPLLAPPSRALDLTGGLQAGHLSPENLDLSALGLHGSRAGVGGAGGTEGVRAAVEGIRECVRRGDRR